MGVERDSPVEDVSVSEVWQRLKSDADAVLIDVRTHAEWTFVGLPDLSSIGKQVRTVEWQTYPDNRIDPEFAGQLNDLLDRSGTKKDAELFFICRSGGRSRRAAEAASAAGYLRCRNVAGGFEGQLDAERHRGGTGGWKAAGLPWVQS